MMVSVMPDRCLVIRLEDKAGIPVNVPAYRFAEIISATQDAMYRLGEALGGYPFRSRGNLPGILKESCELRVREIGMGSLETVLELPELQAHAKEDLGERSLVALDHVVDAVARDDPKFQVLKETVPDPRFRSRFIQSLVEIFPRPTDKFYVGVGWTKPSLRRLTSKQHLVLESYRRTPPRPTDIELTGAIIEVRVAPDPRHVRVFDRERNQVKCYISDELEDVAIALLRQPVVISGTGHLDRSGELNQLDTVHSIKPLEFIEFREIRWEMETLRLREPIRLQPFFSEDNWSLEYGNLGIVIVAPSLDQCERDFQEEFFTLRKEYAKAPEKGLTEDAKDLKRRINSLVLGDTS